MNDCLIQVLHKEKMLKDAGIATSPCGVTLTNTITGQSSGHACLLFHYGNATWNYDPLFGCVKVFPFKQTWDHKEVITKHYTLRKDLKVESVVPLNISTNFIEDDIIMQGKLKNVSQS